MAQLVISAAGAAAGFVVGGPTGAQIGWAIGSTISSVMAGPRKIQGAAAPLIDLKVVGTDYGQPIPYVRGSCAIPGQMWWNTDRRATTTTTTESSGGKGGGGTEITTSTTTYDMDCLIGLTDNEIIGIARIWDQGKLIYTADSSATSGSLTASAETEHWTRMTVYTGSTTQLPDPTYEAAVGTANACAYRGRSYVFIEGLKLGQSGQVRNLTFEVVADGSTGIAALPPFSTFDASSKEADVVLSNGDLTAVCTTDNFHQVNTTIFKSGSSKLHAEFTYSGGATGHNTVVGINTAAAPMTLGSFPGWDAPSGGTGAGYGIGGDGRLWHNGTSVGVLNGPPNFVAGDRVALLYDEAAQTLRVKLNGVEKTNAGAPAFSGVTPGAYCLAAAVRKNGAVSSGVTMNVGASSFSDTLESGYIGWGTTTADTVTATPPTVQSVVSALCVRAGLTAGQIDVTGLSSITRTVRCLPITQVAPTRQALELLMAAYFFEMTLSDKLYFRVRGGSSVASIPYIDLGASATDEPSEPLALRENNDIEIPAQLMLSYINVSDDYQTGTEPSDRLISATAGTVGAVQMSLGLTPAEAKAVVDTMLLDQYASRWSAPIALLGDYARLEPTDVVTVTAADDSTFRLRLVKKTDSYPLLQFHAVLDDASVLTSQGITSTDYTPSTVVSPAVNTEMELLDIPILQDADNDSGFYVATKGDGTPYPGSALFYSTDGGTEYTRKATVLESAVFGTCTTTLGDWTGARVIDNINTVTVNVGDGTLASSTRTAVLNSLSVNAMLIGSELIQFITATLVSPGIYTLSDLLRGGRGTEWAMVDHAASERCVLLRAAGLRRAVLTTSEVGLSLYYKGVTLGRAVSTATAEAFTNTAIGLKPLAPFDLRGARDSSGNVTLSWQRRTRFSVRTIGSAGISVPLDETVEAYEIDIYADGTYVTVLRTISAVSPFQSGSVYEISETGRFVALAMAGATTASGVMTSHDAETWTSRSIPKNDFWAAVTYGAGLFVAVIGASATSGNKIMTSPDGVTWTLQSTPADYAWTAIAYGAGLFVVVAKTGTGDRVMTSPDGITWTLGTTPADNSWSSIVYGGGQFVAVAYSGTGNRVMTSPDGLAWTIQTSAADTNWNSVTYGGGLYVAVDSTGGGAQEVMTSPDGVTWTLRTTPTSDKIWYAVTYGASLFVAVARHGTSNRVMTSPDGVTWTLRASAADNSWVAVAFGGGQFVAVANSGTGNRVMTSPDGITWTQRASADSKDYVGICYSGDSYASTIDTVAVSTQPQIVYTAAEQLADGLTPGNTVYAKVYQLSAAIGRGYALQQAA